MPKEVYIVTDKAHEQYANYLRALISRTDDTPDAPVGAVDGSVSAVVWTEKQYEHNRPEFTSENYVVFIGNGKIIKSERIKSGRTETRSVYKCGSGYNESVSAR